MPPDRRDEVRGLRVTACRSGRALRWHLGDAPVYMTPDEVIISVDAHSIATTGRDVHGVSMPLFFKVQMRGEKRMGWFMPVIFYAIAAVLKVMPLSEVSARLPTVLRRPRRHRPDLFRRAHDVSIAIARADRSGDACAHAGALHPEPLRAGLSLPRAVSAGVAALPACLPRARAHADAVRRQFILGVGFYSYIAAVLMTPVYLIFTSGILFYARKPLREYAIAAAGFAVPLLPFVLWYTAHPTAFADTVGRYAVSTRPAWTLLQGLRSFLSYNSLESRAAVYWSFLIRASSFSPATCRCRFRRERSASFSTRCGVPVAGIASAIRHSTPASLAVLGFFTAPVAAVLVPENSEIIRAASMLPFAILLATWVSSLCGRGRSGRVRVLW